MRVGTYESQFDKLFQESEKLKNRSPYIVIFIDGDGLIVSNTHTPTHTHTHPHTPTLLAILTHPPPFARSFADHLFLVFSPSSRECSFKMTSLRAASRAAKRPLMLSATPLPRSAARLPTKSRYPQRLSPILPASPAPWSATVSLKTQTS